MAAPTLVSGLTDWMIFETTPTFTSIGGGAGASVSADFFRQGSQSAGRKAGSTGRYGFAVTVTSVDMTVSGRYLWVWWAILYSPNQLATRADGGVRILVGTGGVTNYYEYYIGGSDFSPDGTPVQAGKWYRSVIDINNATPSSTGGTGATKTAIDRIGITVNYTSTPTGNLSHFYIDGVQYGSGFQFTGGTSGDPVTPASISAYTETQANAWGVMQNESGAYFSNGLLTIGNGATSTHFLSDGELLLVRPQEFYNGSAVDSLMLVNSNGLVINGSATNFTLKNSVIKTVSIQSKERWKFSTTGTPTLVDIQGNTLTKANQIILLSGHICRGNSFDNCYQIDPGTSTFENNSVKNYSEATTNGALFWPGGTTVKSCSFQSCDEAIEVTQTANQTFDALTFSNNTYDVHLNNGGTSIDVSKNNGSNPTTYIAIGGGVVTYVGASVTVKVAVQNSIGTDIQNANVLLVTSQTVSGGLPYQVTVTITNSGTTATVSHTGHGLATGDKVMIKGASHYQNNGVFTVTVTGTNSYTYTLSSVPGSNPTGTIISTFVFLFGTTDVNGEISMSRVLGADQGVIGWARKSSAQPYYKTSIISGIASSTSNTSFTSLLILDE